MRKHILSEQPRAQKPPGAHWLDLEALARVELTSEDPAHPIESALAAEAGSGWRATGPGEQTIRIHFDAPQKLRRIYLLFREDKEERTQEFLLRWSQDGGQSYREILRQQYHFSPPGTVEEREDYTVSLDGVTTLELVLVPDMGRGKAAASLARLQLASG